MIQFKSITLSIIMLISTCLISGCESNVEPISPEQTIEKALRVFCDSLSATSMDSSVISMRIKEYLQSHDNTFFGSTVCIVDSNMKAVASPYWYRGTTNLLYKDLAKDPAYAINTQEWLTKPLQSGTEVWSAPYFDTGGGEIWMKTLSIPIKNNGKIVAIATTDMRL
ncbi:MAG: cache domain-containing protein [Ignavibacteria bacterium]|jgi:sigma-B regulation protein RsbU (phosphoserine phosphatase)